MYRVYLDFHDGKKRTRFAETKTAAQLIAMKETIKRKTKFFTIDDLNVKER